jgi:ceramide glucosyltransferase
MSPLYVALIVGSTVGTLAGVISVARVLRRRRLGSVPGGLPPVSVLKPLCGADDSLEANLRTFFEQSHDHYELVFGVQGDDDPAVDIVRALRDVHPEIPVRLVVHDGGRGVNPKVSNLRAMLEAVEHDVVVISDSNVAVDRFYLQRLCTDLEEPGVGLVTSPIAGVGERSLGATLDALHLNGVIAGGVATANELVGHPAVIGKSMMFRRSVFERLGGFGTVANVLAEDYVIGRMFHAAGYEVRLAATPVRNVTGHGSVRGFHRRLVRWGMMRFRLAPIPFLLEPLSMPLVVALAAPLFGVEGRWVLVWGVLLTLGRDAAQWTLLRGSEGLLRALPWFPLRDLLTMAAWCVAPFKKHVEWRGNRVRVSAGSRLYAEVPPEEPAVLMVES